MDDGKKREGQANEGSLSIILTQNYLVVGVEIFELGILGILVLQNFNFRFGFRDTLVALSKQFGTGFVAFDKFIKLQFAAFHLFNYGFEFFQALLEGKILLFGFFAHGQRLCSEGGA